MIYIDPMTINEAISLWARDEAYLLLTGQQVVTVRSWDTGHLIGVVPRTESLIAIEQHTIAEWKEENEGKFTGWKGRHIPVRFPDDVMLRPVP